MLSHVLWFLLAAAVLIGIVAVWIGITYWLTPHVEDPDASARITGSCGDTMEIRLKIRGGRVVDASHWTNGCAYSFNCVCSAADLARGKSPDEILDIDADQIQRSVGGLPADHLHCARLAEETIQAALDDYMKKTTK